MTGTGGDDDPVAGVALLGSSTVDKSTDLGLPDGDLLLEGFLSHRTVRLVDCEAADEIEGSAYTTPRRLEKSEGPSATEGEARLPMVCVAV